MLSVFIVSFPPSLSLSLSLSPSLSPVVDSKCNYPAACNSMENLFIHRDLVGKDIFHRLIATLRDYKVCIHTPVYY